MKLKKYSEFINESFGSSKEYQDLLKSKSISLDIFYDTMFDVKQFARVNIYRYLIDSKGHTANNTVDDDEKYRMLYTCQIQYNLTPGKNNFNKIVENLNTIKISIEEMIDRIESEGLKLESNEYWVDKTTGHEKINHTFSISFLGEEVETQELKKSFDKYKNFRDKEYIEGLERLRQIYRGNNIDFDRYMDTDDDGDYIMIGLFIDDDLYAVASYDKSNKIFSIDEDEINNSIEDLEI